MFLGNQGAPFLKNHILLNQKVSLSRLIIKNSINFYIDIFFI